MDMIRMVVKGTLIMVALSFVLGTISQLTGCDHWFKENEYGDQDFEIYRGN